MPALVTPTKTLVALSGFARSGKDSAAGTLVARGWTKRSFADPLRATVRELNPLLPCGRRWAEVEACYGYEDAKAVPGFREALQDLGVAARRNIDPDVWVNATLRCLGKDPRVVIADCRFRNEADAIRERGGLVIRIERDGVGAQSAHVSEHDLDGYNFDAVVRNDGDLEHLSGVLGGQLVLLGMRVGEAPWERATQP